MGFGRRKGRRDKAAPPPDIRCNVGRRRAGAADPVAMDSLSGRAPALPCVETLAGRA